LEINQGYTTMHGQPTVKINLLGRAEDCVSTLTVLYRYT